MGAWSACSDPRKGQGARVGEAERLTWWRGSRATCSRAGESLRRERGRRRCLCLSAHAAFRAGLRARRPLTPRAPMHVGELVPVTSGAGWSRCTQLGASRSPRWWCSRTTSQDGGSVRGGRGRPRRAKRAGWGGTPAACRPTRPGAARGRGACRAWGVAVAVTPRSTRTSSSRPVTPCWVRCSTVSSLARFSWVEAGTTRALTGSRSRRPPPRAWCPSCGRAGRRGRGR